MADPSSPSLVISNTGSSTSDVDPVTQDENHDDALASPTTSSTFVKGPILNVQLIVLVHGILGNTGEMEYLKTALETEVVNNHQDVKEVYKNTVFRVHAAACNEQRTLDGVASGGLRLAQEINEVLYSLEQEFLSSANSVVSELNIFLSIVGFSLGGLYSRFCLPHIVWNRPSAALDVSSAKHVTLHPRLFATIATPHLGCQNNTLICLPRTLEYVGARSMKQTGQDLFRFNDRLQELGTHPGFLEPLANFSRRRAYVNAFNTDACVTTASGAFLSNQCTTVHRVVSNEDGERLPHCPSISFETEQVSTDDTELSSSFSSFVKVTEEPVASENSAINNAEDPVESESSAINGEDAPIDSSSSVTSCMIDSAIATHLDQLGWTKIFLDVRAKMNPIEIISKGLSRRQLANKEEPEEDKLANVFEFISNSFRRKIAPSEAPEEDDKVNDNVSSEEGTNKNSSEEDKSINATAEGMSNHFSSEEDVINNISSEEDKGKNVSSRFSPFEIISRSFSRKQIITTTEEPEEEEEKSESMLSSSGNGKFRRSSSFHHPLGGSYSSADLVVDLSMPKGQEKPSLPFGHSMLVASGKGPIHKFLYKSGQTIVEEIARDLLEHILQ